MKLYFRIIIITLFPSLLFAQSKYSNDFLTIGVGARSHGLGGTQVAIVNDGTAGFWNPSAMSNIQSNLQLSAMHAEIFAGIQQYDFLSFVKPLNVEKKSALGISVIRLGIDNIPNTLNLYNTDGTSINYDKITSFSAADLAFLISYCQQLGKTNWVLGGSAKIINTVIGPFGTAWGFGLDASVLYKKKNFSFGFVAKDISTTFNAWKFSFSDEEKQVLQLTDNEIPVSSVEITLPRFITGVGYYVPFTKKLGLLSSIDAEINTDGQRNVLINSKSLNISPRAGIEFDYDKTLFIRAGVQNFQYYKDIETDKKALDFQPNFGVGLKIGRLRIDYALANIGKFAQIGLYSHIISLNFDLKKKQKPVNFDPEVELKN